jgi:hypothetical protein
MVKGKKHDVILDLDKRWRLVEFQNEHPGITLWESSNRQECEHALVMRQDLKAKAQEIKELLKGRREVHNGPHGTTLNLKNRHIEIFHNGEKIGYGAFEFTDKWELVVTAGLPHGAMMVSNIHIDEEWRKKGLAGAMHQLIQRITGLPTVPSAVNGAPGSLSDEAQLFWSHRAVNHPVPGLGDENTLKRAFAFYRATLENQKRQYSNIFNEKSWGFYFIHQASLFLDWDIVQVATHNPGQVLWAMVSQDKTRILNPFGLHNLESLLLGSKPPIILSTLSKSQFGQLASIWMKQDAILIQEVDLFVKEILVRYGLLPEQQGVTLEEFRTFKEMEIRSELPILADTILGCSSDTISKPRR